MCRQTYLQCNLIVNQVHSRQNHRQVRQHSYQPIDPVDSQRFSPVGSPPELRLDNPLCSHRLARPDNLPNSPHPPQRGSPRVNQASNQPLNRVYHLLLNQPASHLDHPQINHRRYLPDSHQDRRPSDPPVSRPLSQPGSQVALLRINRRCSHQDNPLERHPVSRRNNQRDSRLGLRRAPRRASQLLSPASNLVVSLFVLPRADQVQYRRVSHLAILQCSPLDNPPDSPFRNPRVSLRSNHQGNHRPNLSESHRVVLLVNRHGNHLCDRVGSRRVSLQGNLPRSQVVFLRFHQVLSRPGNPAPSRSLCLLPLHQVNLHARHHFLPVVNRQNNRRNSL